MKLRHLLCLVPALALIACKDTKDTDDPIGPIEEDPTYADVILADSPVAYWRFEETTGSVADDETGNGNVGTYVFGPHLGDSLPELRTGRAIHLTQELAGVEAVDTAWSEMSAFTAEAWIRPDSVVTPEGMIIIDKGATWNLFIQPDGKPAVQFPGPGARRAVALTPIVKGQLYHLVGTQENGVFRLYVNGVLAGEYASTQQLSLRDHPIRVGRGVSSPFSFYGLIDEVAVYDRVLSGADVLRHYDAGFDIVDD